MYPLVQYFTKTGINLKLLKLGNLKGETSDIVSSFCIQTLKDLKIDIKKCIGFGRDNANVNFGRCEKKGVNKVYNKLKIEIGADIEGIGCPAHILHNTLQTAADQLSCDVDQVVLKLLNYFVIYTVGTERLKNFCDFVNVEYKKLLSHSKTRWLSLQPAIERVLELFDALNRFSYQRIQYLKLYSIFSTIL